MLSRSARIGIYCCSAMVEAVLDGMRTSFYGCLAPGGPNEDYRHDWIGAEEQRGKECPVDCAGAIGLRSARDDGRARYRRLAGPFRPSAGWDPVGARLCAQRGPDG